MRAAVVAAIVGVMLPSLAGAQAPPAAKPPAAKPSHLQGQVVDSAGHPLRGAVVETDDPPRATISDNNGYFRFRELPAGPITVRVRLMGFEGTEFQLRLPADSTVGIGVKLRPDAPQLDSVHVDAAAESGADAMARKLRVVSTEGQPVVYANVVVEGSTTRITDEKGEVSFGVGKRQGFTVRVRRIGFAPWFGKVNFADTAAVFTITLPGLAQTLAPVTVTGEAAMKSPLALTGFYDRWMMRQKGTLSATFIGPEEIEHRHPSKISQMLQGLNGVQLRCNSHGECAPFSTVPTGITPRLCPMAILVDGQQHAFGGSIDQFLDANEVMAIEYYPRGGNMPVSLQANNNICGVVAFWTGARQ